MSAGAHQAALGGLGAPALFEGAREYGAGESKEPHAKLEFDQLAEHLESLTIWQGPKAGQRFEIMPWQDRFLR